MSCLSTCSRAMEGENATLLTWMDCPSSTQLTSKRKRLEKSKKGCPLSCTGAWIPYSVCPSFDAFTGPYGVLCDPYCWLQTSEVPTLNTPLQCPPRLALRPGLHDIDLKHWNHCPAPTSHQQVIRLTPLTGDRYVVATDLTHDLHHRKLGPPFIISSATPLYGTIPEYPGNMP